MWDINKNNSLFRVDAQINVKHLVFFKNTQVLKQKWLNLELYQKKKFYPSLASRGIFLQ